MANAAGWWVDYKHKLELTVESVLPPKDWWRSPPERKPEPGHVEHAVRVYEQYKLLAGTRDAPHDRLAAIRAWLFKARQLYQMERFAANKTRASRAEALEIARRAGVLPEESTRPHEEPTRFPVFEKITNAHRIGEAVKQTEEKKRTT